MGLLRRFVNALRPERLGRDFDEELEFHRQMRLRKGREQGLNPAEAEQEATRRLGNQLIAKEQMREARVLGWLASSLQDLRHGVVLLRRDASVSALIVLVLALGIGGNAAIFTLLKAAFLDSLPYRDSGRLVTIMENSGWIPNVSEFVEIRACNRTLEQIAFAEHLDMQLTAIGEPARLFTARVTASFFPLLGVNASLGRTFVEEENQPGRAPSVILTDAFWRSRMGADPAVVGRTLRLDGQSAAIVGVLPPGFHFDYPTLRIPERVDLYVSYPIEPAAPLGASANGRGVPIRVIGRLREGVTLAQAQADLRGVARSLTREHPSAFPNPQNDPSLFSYDVVPLRDAIVGTQRSLLWLLLGGVGVLLLIACANAAQLLLARALRRGREVAIRSALGASRLRLIRQFLLEGLVLAGCGGAAAAGCRLDCAHSRPIAAGTESSPRFRPSGWPRYRVHLGDLADLSGRVRHHPGSEGQPLDAGSEPQCSHYYWRGKPLASHYDCDRGGALRVLALRRGAGGAEPVGAGFDADGLRSEASACDAAEAAVAAAEYAGTECRLCVSAIPG
jgi:hypothetical protein